MCDFLYASKIRELSGYLVNATRKDEDITCGNKGPSFCKANVGQEQVEQKPLEIQNSIENNY